VQRAEVEAISEGGEVSSRIAQSLGFGRFLRKGEWSLESVGPINHDFVNPRGDLPRWLSGHLQGADTVLKGKALELAIDV
jgi:hypothetical protein